MIEPSILHMLAAPPLLVVGLFPRLPWHPMYHGAIARVSELQREYAAILFAAAKANLATTLNDQTTQNLAIQFNTSPDTSQSIGVDTPPTCSNHDPAQQRLVSPLEYSQMSTYPNYGSR